jgi:hypothetical protein
VTQAKRYVDAGRMFDRNELYSPADAIRILREMPGAKFDETVELSIRLGVDPRKADQMIRGTVTLPHGTGKSERVPAYAAGDPAPQAPEAGRGRAVIDDITIELALAAGLEDGNLARGARGTERARREIDIGAGVAALVVRCIPESSPSGQHRQELLILTECRILHEIGALDRLVGWEYRRTLSL